MDDRSEPMERPPVRTNSSGVHEVSPSDILRSRVGRQVIRDAAQLVRVSPPGAGSGPARG